MKLDEYSIPDLDITEAQQLVATIQEDLNGVVLSENEGELAREHGHQTADSGAFRSKITALKDYGFLEGWGEKELTELGKDLHTGEIQFEDLVAEIDLFERAYNTFGQETVANDEWQDFIERQDGADADRATIEKARNRYNELVRVAGPVEGGANISPFRHDRFDKYLEKLQEERTREYAVDALGDQAMSPLPDIQPFEEILTIVDEERYPEFQDAFVDMLVSMCKQSPEMIREHDKEAAIYRLARSQLRADTPAYNQQAVSMLEATFDGEIDDEWATELWEIALTLLSKGAQKEDGTTANRGEDIAIELIEGWASESVRDEIEDTIWDEIGRDDDLDVYYSALLERCRDQFSTQ